MIRCNKININNSVRYCNIILETLNKTALKKVRIKVDPALINSGIDLSKINGYEGYILAEGVGKLKILVLSPELTIDDIPEEFIEAIAEDDKLETFEELKSYILSEMLRSGTQEGDPILCNVASANNLCDIETFLKQKGFTDDKLANLYKNFIMHDEPINEGILKSIAKGTRKAIGGAAALAKGAVEAPFRAVDAAHNVVIGGNVGRALDPIIRWSKGYKLRPDWQKDPYYELRRQEWLKRARRNMGKK
jgi:hypothetical protein